MDDFETRLITLLRGKRFNTIQELLYTYLNLYEKEFNTIDILDMIDDLDIMYLRPRVIKDGQDLFLANERAGYLKRYLEGKMYVSEEAAKQYVDIQIEHAETIVNACDRKKGE